MDCFLFSTRPRGVPGTPASARSLRYNIPLLRKTSFLGMSRLFDGWLGWIADVELILLTMDDGCLLVLMRGELRTSGGRKR